MCAIAKKLLKKVKKIYFFLILCWFIPVIYFLVQTKKGIFHVYLNDFNDLLLPYFSGCKNKKINQKTNPAASKMKVIMTLAEGLFQKLNNITKNSISDYPRPTSLLSILKKKV